MALEKASGVPPPLRTSTTEVTPLRNRRAALSKVSR
jgi:hypothetical protein